MPRQAKQRSRALSFDRLGVMRLINNKQRARSWQCIGQPRPTHQLQRKANGIRLSPPVRMQSHRSHHQNTHLGAAHHGPRRQQHGERFSKTHFIGQNRPTPSQEPAGTGALMQQRRATIWEALFQISSSHKLPVMRQRGKRQTIPSKPFL